MTITVTHAFVSGIADDPKAAAAGEVLPSHWNAQHVVTGSVGRTIISADTTYYVRTTGSDSNGGTSPSDAWATIDHASAFIAANVDSGGHNIIVDIGAGTFTGFGIRTTIGGGNLFFRGGGSASTTINSGPGDFVFNFFENISIFSLTSANLYFNAFTLGANNTVNNMFSIGVPGISANLGDLFSFAIDIIFNLSTVTNPVCIVVSAPGSVCVTGTGTGGIINGNAATASVSYIFSAQSGGTIQDLAVWTVKGTITLVTTFLYLISGFYVSFGNLINLGPGASATGTRYNISGGAYAGGASGLPANTGKLGPSFFPGSIDGLCDPGSSYDGFLGYQTASGLPTSTQFPDPGNGGYYKDTSGGGMYSVFNDGGTIKKVALT